jgi:ankyrin repeat and SOCS box protein 17
VALQASAPDMLMILLRYGGNPNGDDAGASPILALLDKLIECESGSYPYQLVSCLKLLLLAVPFIELPFKVRD